MAQDTKHLQRKGEGTVWNVVVEVPAKHRKTVGKPRFKRSLGTTSLAEANRLKHSHVAEFQKAISDAIGRRENPKTAALRDAVEWRRELATASREVEDEGERTEHVPYDELLSEVKRLASILAEKDPDLGSRYLKAATGEGTILKDYIVPFGKEVVCSGQTLVQHKSTINLYITWAGELTTVEECDRLKAGEYVTHLLTASGLARATIKRHLSSLSQYWLWLGTKGHAKINPWLGHRLGKKKKGVKARTGLSDEKVLKVLQGSYSTKKFDQLLKDLSRLALLHGARLEELCALKKADVHEREDGLWIVIGEAKTDSGVRELPVHPKAVGIIERRMKGDDEYLFAGLTPGGPDNKRSWYVSKAYGRFRVQIGVKDKYEDFHALRHTYIAMMEGMEVAESTTKLLVGHKRTSMTYGLYSKGQRVNLRKAMEMLDYGKAVMAAIQ